MRTLKNGLLIIFFSGLISATTYGQYAAVKTNMLYWATGTVNLAGEIAVSRKSTLEFQWSLNPWGLEGTETDNKKIAHWLLRPEYRYWFCETFVEHSIGVHPFYGKYNIGGHKIPLFLENGAEDYRYKGYLYGIGVSYGYHWILSKYFSLEFTAGAGYARMEHEKYNCSHCGEKLKDEVRHYIGPTRIGISLIYLINK